jgi:hypothetical protein
MKVARLKEAYPTAKVELWSEDEHRLGLKPIIRKVWSPIGQRPMVEVHQRYEWTYLYAFARPKTGEVHWLILPTVSAEAFSMALENFAREVGAGKRKRILLVLDRAPGGTRPRRSSKCPKGYIWSSYPRIPRSYNPPKGSGRFLTKGLRTITSRRSGSLRRRW